METVTEDGRTLRRTRNRDLVVDAMLELVDEGNGVEPSVEQLVTRSGLSERSIFRYFDGLDDLRREVIRRNFERVAPLLAADALADGDLDDRVARFVDARLRACELMAGAGRISRRNAPVEPLLADELARFRRLLADQVRASFAPELQARTRADASDLEVVIEVLVSFDGWDLMSSGYGRSRTQIRRAWTRSLRTLLTGGPA